MITALVITIVAVILYLIGFFKADSENGILHLWAGPAGVHICWPDLWNTRPDWCWKWYEEVE